MQDKARQYWKAYYQGYRKARKIKRFNYTLNTYPNQSFQWYGFNQGWNDRKAGR